MKEFSVADAVDAYIDSVTEDRPFDEKWHPSSMFGCARQAVYQVRGVEPTEETDMLSKRRFYIGHRLHEAVQRALENAKGVAECYPEFEIDVPSLGVVGHGDILIRLEDGRWYMVEVKSIKKWGMKMGLPKENHVQQAMVYAWAVRNQGFNVDKGDGLMVLMPPLGDKLVGIIMVYMEKEELFIVEKPIPWDDSWNGQVAERLVELGMYKDDPDSLPPRLPYAAKGKRHWLCGYCPYTTKCYSVDVAEVPPKEVF